MDVPSDNSTPSPSSNLSLPTGEGIVIDIGTGDGLFVYQCARRNPNKFFIGIDPNIRPLEKISEKIHRKPAKVGLSNVVFLQAAVEDLPSELDGVADEIHIHFPWGSLLRAVMVGDEEILRNLRRVCSRDALLEIVVGVDQIRDRSELGRLSIPNLTLAHVDNVLMAKYEAAGFEIFERGERLPDDWRALETTWSKRLRDNPNRKLLYLIARVLRTSNLRS